MNNQEQQIQNVLNMLRDPHTIRAQSHRILNLAKQNQLKHFSLNPEKMTTTASYIVDIITSRYPELDIPYHSRWRHFEMDGLARVNKLRKQLEPISPQHGEKYSMNWSSSVFFWMQGQDRFGAIKKPSQKRNTVALRD